MIPSFSCYDNLSKSFCQVTSITWRSDGSILQIEIQTSTGKEYRQPKNGELTPSCNGCELG